MGAVPAAVVHVVDDDEGLRGLLFDLMQSAGLAVRVYADAHSFLERWQPDAPGCLLLDVCMPGMDGVALHRRLLDEHFFLPVIFLTGHGSLPMAVDAMRHGAFDFLQKPFCNETLLERVRLALGVSVERWRTPLSPPLPD